MSDIPKYALVEMERRWLVDLARCPPLDECSGVTITDRYVSGTLLRVRKMESVTGEVIYKCCKKYDRISPASQPIVNIYLSENEFELLNQLPGPVVVKRRHRFAAGVIDIYQTGGMKLAIFEIEFQNESSLAEYIPPEFVLREVTGDPRYSGACLAGVQLGQQWVAEGGNGPSISGAG